MRWPILLFPLLAISIHAHGQNQYRCESKDHKQRTHQAEPCGAELICKKWDGSDWSELECQRSKRGNNACRNDALCWGKLAHAEAAGPCERRIELAAKHQSEWTNGILEHRLEPLAWSDENTGVIIFGGDKIKMQNGFGAWTHMIYTCTWDSARKQVVEVGVEPRSE